MPSVTDSGRGNDSRFMKDKSLGQRTVSSLDIDHEWPGAEVNTLICRLARYRFHRFKPAFWPFLTIVLGIYTRGRGSDLPLLGQWLHLAYLARSKAREAAMERRRDGWWLSCLASEG